MFSGSDVEMGGVWRGFDTELGGVYRSYRSDFNKEHSWMWP